MKKYLPLIGLGLIIIGIVLAGIMMSNPPTRQPGLLLLGGDLMVVGLATIVPGLWAAVKMFMPRPVQQEQEAP